MKNNRKDTRWLVMVALFSAIIIVLANTPLGMIQLPIIKATTVHIPVIIGAIVLGPAAGAFLGGVFGICSMIKPLPVGTSVLKRDFPVNLGVTFLLLIGSCYALLMSGGLLDHAMSDNVGHVSRWLGIVLLVIFVAYIAYLISDAKKHPAESEEEYEDMPGWKCFLLIVIGIALIVAGGKAVVYGAKSIALAAGMTETLVGLTIVALGTSLPELVTSIVAARKGETGMAVGNVVGSNIFNILLILGISSAIHPIAVNAASVWDMYILAAIGILTYVFGLSKKEIRRPEGAVMVLLYFAAMAFAIVR